MTTACKINQESHAPMPNSVTLPEYHADIGAPFQVILIDAVRQKISPSGEILETYIPNMSGLLKEVAVARALIPRKFSAEEIRFVRKAVNLKSSELAALLGVSSEHLSRCENRERVLSAPAEKLLRVIILKKRFNLSELEKWAERYLADNAPDAEGVAKLREVMIEYRQCMADVEKAVFDSKLSSVHDTGETLEFGFRLRATGHVDATDMHSQEDDQWKRAA